MSKADIAPEVANGHSASADELEEANQERLKANEQFKREHTSWSALAT